MKKLSVAVLLMCAGLSVDAKTVWTYWTSGSRRYISDDSGWTLRVVEVEIDGVKGIGTDLRPLQKTSTTTPEAQGTDGDLDFTTITNAAGTAFKFIRFGGYLCCYWGGYDVNKSHVTSVVAPDLMDCDGHDYGYEFPDTSAYITNVVLSSEVRSISPRFLQNGTGLKHFEPTSFPKLTYIGAYAFGSTDGKHPVSMPALDCPELLVLGGGAFRLSPMPSINMPKIRDIGGSCFFQSSIAGDYDLPCLTNVQSGAFQAAYLSSMTATNLVSIGNEAFRSAPNLSDFTAGERLEVIGDQAFYGYQGVLTHFTPYLPKSLKYLGHNAFAEASHLISDFELESPYIHEIQHTCFQNCKSTNYVFKSMITNIAIEVFTNLPRGSRLWFYSGCPTFANGSIKTSNRSYVYFGVGKKNADCRAAWNALAAESPIDDTDRARADFPKKAIGKFRRNSTSADGYCYVVPFHLKDGLSVIIR